MDEVGVATEGTPAVNDETLRRDVLDAAQRGHQVWTTLNGGDAVARIIERLTNSAAE